jgi:hypothetical protein
MKFKKAILGLITILFLGLSIQNNSFNAFATNVETTKASEAEKETEDEFFGKVNGKITMETKAFTDEEKKNTVSVETAKNDMKDILTGKNGLLKIVEMLGFGAFIFGIFKLLISIKDENADGKNQAMMIVMGGLFAFGISGIIEMAFKGTFLSGLLK